MQRPHRRAEQHPAQAALLLPEATVVDLAAGAGPRAAPQGRGPALRGGAGPGDGEDGAGSGPGGSRGGDGCD